MPESYRNHHWRDTQLLYPNTRVMDLYFTSDAQNRVAVTLEVFEQVLGHLDFVPAEESCTPDPNWKQILTGQLA